MDKPNVPMTGVVVIKDEPVVLVVHNPPVDQQTTKEKPNG